MKHRFERQFRTAALSLLIALSLVGCVSKRKTLSTSDGTSITDGTTDTTGGDGAIAGGGTVTYQPSVTPTPALPSCQLAIVRPSGGASLPLGASATLHLTTSSTVTSADIRIEGQGASGAIEISPPNNRQIVIRPDMTTTYLVTVRGSTGTGTCRATIPVVIPNGGGSFVGGGTIVVVVGIVITPPAPAPIPVTPLRLVPICTTDRRKLPKLVYRDIVNPTTVSGGKNTRAVLSIEGKVPSTGKKEVLFARRLEQDAALLNGGHVEDVPTELLELAGTNDVEFRVCFDSNANWRCSDETVNNIVSVGKEKAGTFTWLDQTVMTVKGPLPSQLEMNVWNHRNVKQGAADQTCMTRYSPLVLDTRGDGIVTSTPEDSGVAYDINAVNEIVRTGWVAGDDDAFLVRDLNKDGDINNGAELFGNATKLPNGARAAQGFEALAALDDNKLGNGVKDGKITPLDSKYSELKLWFARDFRSLAQSPPPALYPLSGFPLDGDMVSVEEINLSYVDIFEIENGNETTIQSLFTIRRRGVVLPRFIADIWFRVLPY